MAKSAVSKVMWVGRATVFLVGLAVVLALLLGAATAALAGTGVGAAFNLGQINTVNAVSKLVGSTDAAMLLVDNNSAGTKATALTLLTEPNKPPMKVSSVSGTAKNLSADELDGKDSAAFAPAQSAPLWAVVNADSTIRRSSPGVTGSTPIGGGFYQLTFDRDVSSCGYSATLDVGTGGEVSTYRGINDTAQSVRISTRNSAGNSTPIPFHLVVFC